jgi:hypothetical protein
MTKVTIEDYENKVNLKANQTDLLNLQNHLKNLQSNL